MATIKTAIKILGRRKEWLTKRVGGSELDLSFDKAEIAAIDVALECLNKENARNEMTMKYLEMKINGVPKV